MGASQRRKGADGEREVCALLRDEFGIAAKRTLSQARDGGTDILNVKPFAIEVKRRKRVAGLYEWLEQANVGSGIPTLFVRSDGHPWLVVMGFSDWARLARGEMGDTPHQPCEVTPKPWPSGMTPDDPIQDCQS